VTGEVKIGVLGRAIVDTLIKDCDFNCGGCGADVDQNLARAHYTRLMTEKVRAQAEPENFFCPNCRETTHLLRDHKKGPRKGFPHATL
jgi:hypothetical protein